MGDTTQGSGWQLDERGAEAYERNLVPRFMDRGAARLIAVADLRPGEHAIDVACGTAIVARHAARRVGPDGRVDAIDINPAMLAVARRTTADDPVISVKEAAAEDLPYPDGSYDAVFCQYGLQFFPDRRAAVDEARRVLRDGGRYVVSTCRSIRHQPGYAVLVDVLARHVGVEAADIVRSPYGFGEGEEVRSLLQEAGLRGADVSIDIVPVRFASAVSFLRAETASSPLGDVLARLDDDVQQALTDDLATALAPHTDDRGVVFPFETTVVTAHT